MVDKLKITVVTCSYNQAEFLECTIDSVLSQNYSNLEYIIIDGGSDDGSQDIIKKYEGRLSYWISEPDEGQTDALIKGFNKATGDVCCWLNSDDLFEPHTLQEVSDFFVSNPEAEIVYGDATWIGRDGSYIKPKKEHGFNRFIWMHDYNYIPQPSTFWRRKVYEQVGGLDKSFDLVMDADLWIRFADVTNIHHVPKLWSRMRFYPEQKNQRLREKSNLEDIVIRQRYIPQRSSLVKKGIGSVAKTARVGLKLFNGCYW